MTRGNNKGNHSGSNKVIIRVKLRVIILGNNKVTLRGSIRG